MEANKPCTMRELTSEEITQVSGGYFEFGHIVGPVRFSEIIAPFSSTVATQITEALGNFDLREQILQEANLNS